MLLIVPLSRAPAAQTPPGKEGDEGTEDTDEVSGDGDERTRHRRNGCEGLLSSTSRPFPDMVTAGAESCARRDQAL